MVESDGRLSSTSSGRGGFSPLQVAALILSLALLLGAVALVSARVGAEYGAREALAAPRLNAADATATASYSRLKRQLDSNATRQTDLEKQKCNAAGGIWHGTLLGCLR